MNGMIVFLIHALPVLQNEHFWVPIRVALHAYECFDTMPTLKAMDGRITSGAVDSTRVNQKFTTLPLHSDSNPTSTPLEKKRNPKSVSDSGTFQTASELECVEKQKKDQRFCLDSWRVLRAACDDTHPKTQKTRPFCRVFFGVSWRADLNRRPADYESAALPAELRQQQFCILRNSSHIINRKHPGHTPLGQS
jgi:hypothetical protein